MLYLCCNCETKCCTWTSLKTTFFFEIIQDHWKLKHFQIHFENNWQHFFSFELEVFFINWLENHSMDEKQWRMYKWKAVIANHVLIKNLNIDESLMGVNGISWCKKSFHWTGIAPRIILICYTLCLRTCKLRKMLFLHRKVLFWMVVVGRMWK